MSALRPLTARQRLHVLAKLARMERATNAGRPDPALLSRGFLSAKRALYPFDRYPRALFLTDWQVETRLLRINPPEAVRTLTDKRALHRLCAEGAVPLRMPTLLGVAADGTITEDRRAGRAAVAKPVCGSGGEGVRVLGPGEAMPASGRYLLEEVVVPLGHVAAVFPGALPTLRVLTARDEAGSFVLGAAHRFGSAASAPTDNFKRGGVVAELDLASYRLGEAVMFPEGRERRASPDHPDTGVRIEGLALPEADDALRAALAGMNAMPDLAYAGWDFALTGDGPVLIEANAALPNPNLIQAHRPLLADARARCFFERAGVITKAAARAARAALS